MKLSNNFILALFISINSFAQTNEFKVGAWHEMKCTDREKNEKGEFVTYPTSRYIIKVESFDPVDEAYRFSFTTDLLDDSFQIEGTVEQLWRIQGIMGRTQAQKIFDQCEEVGGTLTTVTSQGADVPSCLKLQTQTLEEGKIRFSGQYITPSLPMPTHSDFVFRYTKPECQTLDCLEFESQCVIGDSGIDH